MTGLHGLHRWLRTGPGCPAGSELTRAASEGPVPRLQAHLERCADCAAEVASLQRLAAELGALPEPPMRPEAFEQIATALLGVSAPGLPAPSTSRVPPSRSGSRALGTLSAALCGLVVVGGVWLSLARPKPLGPSSPARQAVTARGAAIRAFGDAHFERVQPAPDEQVRLDEGTLQLDVPSLGPTESFRVLTMDADVQARATQLEMTALGGRLTRVRVWSGRVEIHSSRFAVTVLETGDQWNSEVPAPASTAAPRPSASKTPRRRTPSVPARAIALLGAAPSPASPAAAPGAKEQLGFDRAWALLREGHAADAATAFSETARRARGTSLEEDAEYWHAVALARAGDGAGAQRSLAAFLDRFPRSLHAGEASVALGWMRFEGGETTAARTLFERAASDASPRVRDSALEGLQRTAP